MPRDITLYYASISLSNSLKSLFLSVAWWIRSQSEARARLIERIQNNFHRGSWFCFGSARGALAACLKAAGVGRDDEVILTSYTCLAVPTAVLAIEARPVYVDIDAGTLNVRKEEVLGAITSRTKAVVVQHTMGSAAPVVEIIEAVRPLGITVIEDCALSLGVTLAGRPVGTFADVSVYSMELSKTLSCGWGGLLLVNRPALQEDVDRLYRDAPEQSRLQSFRDLLQIVISTWCNHPWFVNFPGKYVMRLAWGLRLFRPSTPPTEYEGLVRPDFIRKMGFAQALLGRLQWEDSQEILARCRANVAVLRQHLIRLGYCVPALSSAVDVPLSNRVCFFVHDRESILDFFRRHRIELGVWFDGPLSPVPSAPSFNYHPGRYPKAELAAAHVVNLPAHSRLSTADIERICQLLGRYAKEHPDSQAAF